MHGLNPDTDLGFLLGRTLREVDGSSYQVRAVFDGGVEIAVECECEVDHARVSLNGLASTLSPFVGRSVKKYEHVGDGGVRLVFDDGRSLTLLDLNEDFESYNISWTGGTIVV